MREREIEEVERIFREYGLEGDALKSVVGAVASNRQRWVDFMMRFELGLERPHPKRAPISAATIGGSYVVGGLIPLVPYMFTKDVGTAQNGHEGGAPSHPYDELELRHGPLSNRRFDARGIAVLSCRWAARH